MTNKLVMIVDDEKEFASSLSALLKKKGYDSITAYSAKEALEQLEKNKQLMGILKNRIKCIILDIKMPGMDGLQFLKKIREEYQERIGVIILSAYEDEKKWEKAGRGAVAGYLTKPFQERDLLNHLERFFSGQEDQMIEMTRFKTEAKGFAAKIKKDFDADKIRREAQKEGTDK